MDFVFLSTQAWDEMGGAGRPTHYLARQALLRGHRVLFIEVVASQTAAAEKNLTVMSFDTLGYDEQALRRAWFGLDPRVNAIESVDAAAAAHVKANDYRAAIGDLAKLRAPVDAFFEKVLVNDPDAAVRANLLHLLAALRNTMHLVADFSKIAG